MKRGVKIIIFIIGLLILAGGAYGGYHYFTSQSTPSEKTSTTKKVQHKKEVHIVALGDSLTQGVGDQQKKGGYVSIIKQKVEKQDNTKVITSNFGVAGDRSDQILKRLNDQSNVQQKLKSADVIVMTVGGNDLMQTLEKNLFVSSQTKFETQMGIASKKYDNKLNDLFTTVRKYNSNAPIFLFSVYNPFYVYFANMSSITTSVSNWNKDTKTTLAGYGPAYFVDVNNLMSHGQYTTQTQQQKLVQQANAANSSSVNQKEITQIMSKKNQNLNKYISTADNFHPNHQGYEKMADKLFKEMQIHQNWLEKGK
ncbi:GDSL family lipase [Paucilactobacillus hokkaidonensis JCM 18461]|uniref:GDSL family lipase n=2 Tax=Paucilactobacillus hokkaidonensis TaxID=1193095 RepID=A0A0A1GXR8_9LACO|nr:SGNH/GDSL hydrolase family protein [Paucilactobacillus hokkaidonensis]KRO10677.1 hypothetical protein IV59_GL001368 [Paucilactobacillus hokkaidonensis]BAP85669.1 GDSL family lipase [Paucilactobacillus hokkaidonensis JCM 18461]